LEILKPEATISTLQAKSLVATNSEDVPDEVKPVRSHETFKGPFRHVFPAGSVTVIALQFQ
jgi:alpha-L-arabinofuranosidase